VLEYDGQDVPGAAQVKWLMTLFHLSHTDIRLFAGNTCGVVDYTGKEIIGIILHIEYHNTRYE
jgi:hypothetical protein